MDRNVYSSTTHNYTADSKLFSENMINYWANFIKNGDPNSVENGYFKTWNKFTGDNYLSFTNKETKMMGGGILTHKCRFWDSMPVMTTSTSTTTPTSTSTATTYSTSTTTTTTSRITSNQNFINSGFYDLKRDRFIMFLNISFLILIHF